MACVAWGVHWGPYIMGWYLVIFVDSPKHSHSSQRVNLKKMPPSYTAYCPLQVVQSWFQLFQEDKSFISRNLHSLAHLLAPNQI